MIIENAKALKSWLSKLLEPICEADPSALSSYVVALLKKNKPEKDLKALCKDQLDVFLQKETDSFVEKLFESLTAKNYLETPGKDVQMKETKCSGGKAVAEEEVGHVEIERDDRRKMSPLRSRSACDGSRTRDDRRMIDCKRWGEDGFRKRAEPRRVRRDLPSSRRHCHIRRSSRMRSRSRSRSVGRARSAERESHRGRVNRPRIDEQRKDLEGSAPILGSSCDLPQQQQQPRPQRPPCSGGPVTASCVAMVMPAHLPDSTTESCSGPCSDHEEAKPLHKGAVLRQRCHDDGGECAEAHSPETAGAVQAERAQDQQLIPQAQSQRPPLIGRSSRETDTPISSDVTCVAADVVIQRELYAPARQNEGPQQSRGQESRKRPLGPDQGPQTKQPWMDKLILNDQPKLTVQKSHYAPNTKLEVRKIPRELNNITKLNEHFAKFGTIVNIQVGFGGDPEAALLQYASNGEARRAIDSAEAFLNNRFIQVRWHRDGRQSELRGHTPQGQGYSAPSGPPHASIHKAMSASACLQKTAYSSPIVKLKKLEAQKAMKKKQEALNLQQKMRKVQQKMLEKQIECQKVLISRLERNKAVKPEERAGIIRTLKELSEKISRLKEDVRSACVSSGWSARPSLETDARKGLVDAELDVQKKLISGEDSAVWKKKFSQLQVEARRLGLISAGGKAAPPLDRGRGARGRGVGGQGGGGHLPTDHCLQARTVEGETSETEERSSHSVKFRDAEEVQDHDAVGTGVTSRTRSAAEIAADQGDKFKGHALQMSFYRPEIASEPMTPEEHKSKEGTLRSCLLPGEDDEGGDDEDDDDDEDEHESRSWRR